jgi:hypothetical protein
VDTGVRERAYEFRGTLATVLRFTALTRLVFALSAGLMGTASKSAALGVAVGWGCGSPAQDSDRGCGGRVLQRAKAVVFVDEVALVALDLATPPTWSGPGGPALQLRLARRVNYRRGGNDLRDNATGTSDGYSPVSAETPDGKCN